jgi:hypothetical protein
MNCCAESSGAATPVAGWLPFNEVGQPLEIWRGNLCTKATDGRRATAGGRVILDWQRKPRLLWSVDADALNHADAQAWSVRLDERTGRRVSLDYFGHSSEIVVHFAGDGHGWSNGGDVGASVGDLHRVVAHWVNLPWLHSGLRLHEHDGDSWWTRGGRSKMRLAEWDLVIDARHDHAQTYPVAKGDASWVVTHVMEVRRADGALFTPASVQPLLAALQYGISFGLGYWSCPAVPVGLNASGEPVWSAWRPLFADPPREGLGWWNPHRPQDLWAFMELYLSAYQDSERQHALRLSTTSALSGVETGFVEQRLMTCMAALEMHCWLSEQAAGQMPDRYAHKRLRRLLRSANVAVEFDAAKTPRLVEFMRRLSLNDAAKTITEIRHRITHPSADRMVYEIPGLVAEASRVALHYLDLVLLHWLGYRGDVVDRTDRSRWAGQSQPVPWT